MRAKFRFSLVVLLAAVVLFAIPASAQQLSKRLIMKDGSYQLVTKWEIHGDRVRYYSAERDDWEEVPNSLVDWDTTNKYEQDRASGNAAKAFQLHKELTEERQTDEARSPEVATGLRLEDPHAAYLLDKIQDQQQLIQLQQTGGTVETDTKKSVFHLNVTPKNQYVTLPGAHAAIQVHWAEHFYVNSGDETSSPDENTTMPAKAKLDPTSSSPQKITLPWDRFRIVDVQSRPDKRVVGFVEISVKEQSFEKTTSKQLTGGWIEITPTTALPPGEYALVEMLDEKEINLYVWDFGVNPQAPPNANAEAQPAAPVSTQSPELQKR